MVRIHLLQQFVFLQAVLKLIKPINRLSQCTVTITLSTAMARLLKYRLVASYQFSSEVVNADDIEQSEDEVRLRAENDVPGCPLVSDGV